MSHSVATIINFCSNEYRFLEKCIEQARKFSKEIYITVCDHFFDGTEENVDLIHYIFTQFPDCKFIYYPFLLHKISKKLQKKLGDNFCCGFSRYLGYFFSDPKIEYLLFLDADEIVEGELFLKWLDRFPIHEFSALRLANYWYFREDCFRAKNLEDSALFIKRALLSKKNILQEGDRNALFKHVKGKKLHMVLSNEGKPLLHHYSWVRTKEEMRKKVLSWGHRKERDWVSLVEKEFSAPFSGKDFVHGYTFETVKPFVKISLEANFLVSKEKCQVKKISEKTLLDTLQPWSFFLKEKGLIKRFTL